MACDIKITVKAHEGERLAPEENTIEFLKGMELLFDSLFLAEAFKDARETVEKLKAERDKKFIPVKPMKFKIDYGSFSTDVFHCPYCFPKASPSTVADTVVKEHELTCKKCGQALDWSDGERKENE